MRTPASSWAAPSASRSTRTPILTTMRTRCPTPRSRRPDGRRGGGSRATTHGDGRTGSGCHRTSADMPTAQAPLKRRIVAGTLALLLLVPSGLLAAEAEPAPPYPPPPPPVVRPVPPPRRYYYPPPPRVAPPPPLSPVMRVIYAPFYAAGLVVRYGVYYVLVAAREEAERASYGLVQLRGVPDGAAVDLDGRFWLKADGLDQRWLAVPHGEHTLAVRVRGSQPVERRVEVKPGKTSVVRFGPFPQPAG